MYSLAEGIAAARRQTDPPPSVPTVGRYMETEGVVFRRDQAINTVIDSLGSHHISGAAVIDGNNQVVGFVSEHDCLRVIVAGAYAGDDFAEERKVASVMSHNVTTLSENLHLHEAAEVFIRSGRRRLPVVRGTYLVGHLSRAQLLKAVRSQSA